MFLKNKDIFLFNISYYLILLFDFLIYYAIILMKLSITISMLIDPDNLEKTAFKLFTIIIMGIVIVGVLLIIL